MENASGEITVKAFSAVCAAVTMILIEKQTYGG